MATRKTVSTLPQIAVGYVRVSTEKQAETGVSLEAQAEKIRAMAVVQGVELAEIITDAGESAKSIDRPGLARLLEMVDSGRVRTVIIAKLDRLTRSVKDLAELLERFQRHGVSLVSVAESLDTASAAGRLVLERTKTALDHKRKSGRVFNHVPYGFIREGDALVPLADEQAIVSRIRLYRSNGYSLGRIAETLNAEGIPTKLGNKWFPQTVKDVLANAPEGGIAA